MPEHLIPKATGSFIPGLTKAHSSVNPPSFDTESHASWDLYVPGLGMAGLSSSLHLLGATGTTSQETASISSQMGSPRGCQSSEHYLSHGGEEVWKVPCVTASHLVLGATDCWGGWEAAWESMRKAIERPQPSNQRASLFTQPGEGMIILPDHLTALHHCGSFKSQ